MIGTYIPSRWILIIVSLLLLLLGNVVDSAYWLLWVIAQYQSLDNKSRHDFYNAILACLKQVLCLSTLLKYRPF